MTYVIMGLQLLLSLSILIVLHEMGHFFPARWFKTRVEKFFLFFDFGDKKLWSTKKGETEYGIGWLPLGGYVKIAGMVDESFDTEQLKNDPEPWEFRSKPAWQRLIIMLGGVTVNFILGMLLFMMIVWYYGEDFIPATEVKNGIYVEEIGKQMGLQIGDDVLAVGDKPLTKFNDGAVKKAIIFDDARTMKIRRNGQEMTLNIPDSILNVITKRSNKDKAIFVPRMPFVVGEVTKGMGGEKAGVQLGDNIIAINDSTIRFYDEFSTICKTQKDKNIKISLVRGTDTLRLDVKTDTTGKVGLRNDPKKVFKFEHVSYSLAEAIPKGWERGWSLLTGQISAFGKIFSGEIKATESMGGFASMASMFGGTWDWQSFWNLTATLSLVLAFMNLLPIPALDGGHVIFLMYEMISGRKPNEKVYEYATMFGFFLVLALILFVNGLDIWHGIKGLFK